MANVLLRGTVLTGAGVAVVGATVEVFDRDTTTPVRATFTGGTDASGDWNFSYAPGANARRVDVRITNGTSISFLKFDDQIQVSSVETANLRIINPAFTFEYDIVPAAITAAWALNLPLLTADDTIVVLALAQTLTNKTLTTPSISQIAFPATQVASAGANTLDDYEEGTWTPTIQDDTRSNAESQTYTEQVGGYTKIGRVVAIHFRVRTSSLGTLTTTQGAVVGGLPFAATADTNADQTIDIGYGDALAITAGQAVGGYLAANTSVVALVLWDGAAGISALLLSEFSADGQIIGGSTYRV